MEKYNELVLQQQKLKEKNDNDNKRIDSELITLENEFNDNKNKLLKEKQEINVKFEEQNKLLCLELNKLSRINDSIYRREGDLIYFGAYYVKDDKKLEPLVWNILEEKDGKALIITCDIIDSVKYDDYSNTYKDSFIRNWLNNYFYKTAFNYMEQNSILITMVDNSEPGSDSKYHSKSDDTNDKIFLLSYKEAISISTVKMHRFGTSYAISRGLFSHGRGANWWLRSTLPYFIHHRARFVDMDGLIGYREYARVENAQIGVRPACWIKL